MLSVPSTRTTIVDPRLIQTHPTGIGGGRDTAGKMAPQMGSGLGPLRVNAVQIAIPDLA